MAAHASTGERRSTSGDLQRGARSPLAPGQTHHQRETPQAPADSRLAIRATGPSYSLTLERWFGNRASPAPLIDVSYQNKVTMQVR